MRVTAQKPGPNQQKKFNKKREDRPGGERGSLSFEDLTKTFPLTFSIAIFFSACLLFLVQPMIAKVVLPRFGGAPNVWTTCMLFFQAMLLGGYLYAHALTTKLAPKKQVGLHVVLLIVAFGLLLVKSPDSWRSFASTHSPILSLLTVLFLSVGVPFFLLSATAPMLQKWFSWGDRETGDDPYFLYIASNLGSMLSLISYPWLLEPKLGLHVQTRAWSWGFLIFGCLIAICGYLMLKQFQGDVNAVPSEGGTGEETEEDEGLSMATKLSWIFLAFVPSSLMLGVTTYFSTDIASIPLLWVAPLALYLLSFVIAFSRWSEPLNGYLGVGVPVLAVTILLIYFARSDLSLTMNLFVHMGSFFVIATGFHGALSASRPSTKYLTQFYLSLSVGGVLGGIFNGVIAPNVFDTAVEYPVALTLATFLLAEKASKKKDTEEALKKKALLDYVIPLLVGGFTWFCLDNRNSERSIFESIAKALNASDEFRAHLPYAIPALIIVAIGIFSRRRRRMALSAVLFSIAIILTNRFEKNVVHLERSWFGVLKVVSNGSYRRLINGTTLHGAQEQTNELRREPLTYYHRLGPIGDIFREFSGPNKKSQYAVIGLGTGSMAAYGEEGQQVHFYEIDDKVQNIAKTYFSYVNDTPAKVNIHLGDARLMMTEAPDNAYGVIVVDAFSSDSIPVHLLTKEALELYLKKLQPGGIVAIHTSNRYLNLEPIVGRIVQDVGAVALLKHDSADYSVGKQASTWIAVAKKPEDFKSLATNQTWSKLEGFPWTPLWTDDYSAIMSILR